MPRKMAEAKSSQEVCAVEKVSMLWRWHALPKFHICLKCFQRGKWIKSEVMLIECKWGWTAASFLDKVHRRPSIYKIHWHTSCFCTFIGNSPGQRKRTAKMAMQRSRQQRKDFLRQQWQCFMFLLQTLPKFNPEVFKRQQLTDEIIFFWKYGSGWLNTVSLLFQSI